MSDPTLTSTATTPPSPAEANRAASVCPEATHFYTEADLAVMPSQLPSGPILCELHRGRIVTMPPPGDIHGAVEGNLITALKNQGEFRGLGKARSGEVGLVLGRNPDHIVGVDALFITNASLPVRRSSEGYLETIPELVIEVRSKNDTRPEIERKVQDYLEAGVRVVWVPDPDAQIVTEYRQGIEPHVFGEDDTLTIEDLIPGFRLSVRDALQD
jgi:Uma2 family endonuclease